MRPWTPPENPGSPFYKKVQLPSCPKPEAGLRHQIEGELWWGREGRTPSLQDQWDSETTSSYGMLNLEAVFKRKDSSVLFFAQGLNWDLIGTLQTSACSP